MNLFDSHIDAGQDLPPKERAAYYAALVEFVAYGREPEGLKGAAKAVFTAIRPTLELSRARAAAGKAGGESKQDAKQTVKQTAKQNGSKRPSKTEANSEANGQAKGNSNSNSNIPPEDTVVSSAPPYIPPAPTEREVRAYATSFGHQDFDADMFVAHYAAVGWRVRGQPIMDWQAVCRRWMLEDARKAAGNDAGGTDGRYAVKDWDELAG